ncbi:MAG: metallophosphoesterase [Cyanobacteria bacterium]|nr:metallophosphoesterase [Cyanobacteriota bacterium]MDW8201129.1 metallophosphoesterase [Cyanobacteriota bacterium SKYGB_h_bin112]
MRGWHLLRMCIVAIVGLYLALALHACQSAPSPQLPTGSQPQSKPVVPTTTAQAPLPPETKAIVDSVGGLVNPPRGDVRFVVISDLNSVYGSTDYDPEVDRGISLIPFWQPDMVLCSGDMVAGQDPTLTEDRLRAMWAAFDDRVAARLRQMKLPYGFTIGNHDASSALGVTGNFLFQRERDVAKAYWQDPAHDPGVQFIDKYEFPFYFTFEYKDIFFLTWDGSSNHIPDDKLAWVEQALASEKAQAAKMRILLGHLPLYAVAIGRDEPAEVMENTSKLQAMLEKYNVHTYISGHHHSYYPAHKGKLQLLHMGILGSGPRPLVDGTPPRKSITVLDVKFDSPELTTYTTYDMVTLKPIAFNELPRFLTGHNGMVLRRDVNDADLSAAERSQCEQQLSPALCHA